MYKFLTNKFEISLWQVIFTYLGFTLIILGILILLKGTGLLPVQFLPCPEKVIPYAQLTEIDKLRII